LPALGIGTELVEEIEGLRFQVLVGGGIPCYFDGILNLAEEGMLAFSYSRLHGHDAVLTTKKPHHSEFII
jgi:hypothetical protein